METWTVFVVGVVFLAKATTQLDAPELRLHRYLFNSTRFSSAVRPRFNASEPVLIDVIYRLRLVEQVLEKEQKIVLSGWFDLTWRDDFLQWDPLEYGNISRIVVASSQIWLPDVGTPQDKNNLIFSSEQFPVTLSSDGLTWYSPGGTLSIPCKLQMRLYPFDTQNCLVMFSTWNSFPDLITLRSGWLDAALDETNGEWNVTATSISSSTSKTDVAWVSFGIELKRKPINHVVGTLVPVLLLSVLNMMVFCLPPGSSETTNFSVTVLVALSVWLLMLNDALPRSADSVPLTGIYVTASMVASTFSVVIVVISTSIFHKSDDHKLPQWVRAFPTTRGRRRRSFLPNTQVIASIQVQELICGFRQLFRTKLPVHSGTETSKYQPTWKEAAHLLVDFSFYFLLVFQIIFSVAIGIMLAAGST